MGREDTGDRENPSTYAIHRSPAKLIFLRLRNQENCSLCPPAGNIDGGLRPEHHWGLPTVADHSHRCRANLGCRRCRANLGRQLQRSLRLSRVRRKLSYLDGLSGTSRFKSSRLSWWDNSALEQGSVPRLHKSFRRKLWGLFSRTALLPGPVLSCKWCRRRRRVGARVG